MLTASDSYGECCPPSHGGLHFGEGHHDLESWCAAQPGINSWLQADLGATHTVTGVATQGNPMFDEGVARYRLKVSTDGIAWTSVGDFDANSDSSSVVVRRASVGTGRPM